MMFVVCKRKEIIKLPSLLALALVDEQWRSAKSNDLHAVVISRNINLLLFSKNENINLVCRQLVLILSVRQRGHINYRFLASSENLRV